MASLFCGDPSELRSIVLRVLDEDRRASGRLEPLDQMAQPATKNADNTGQPLVSQSAHASRPYGVLLHGIGSEDH